MDKLKPYVPPLSSTQIIAQNRAHLDRQHQLNAPQKGGEVVAQDLGNKAATDNGVHALQVSSRLAQVLKSQGIKGGGSRKTRRFKTHKYIKRNYGRSKRFRIFRKHSRQTKK